MLEFWQKTVKNLNLKRNQRKRPVTHFHPQIARNRIKVKIKEKRVPDKNLSIKLGK